MEKNYYEILGVSEKATIKEIKKAYMKLALQYHPDKNKEGSAIQKFQEIKHIYEILKNPLSKREYDLSIVYQSKYKDAKRGPNPKHNSEPDFSYFSKKDFILNGEEIIKNIFLSKEDFLLGKFQEFSVMVADICHVCEGKNKNCSICKGSGQHLQMKKISINIPAFTQPGTYLKLKGVGHKSPFIKEQGDIFVCISWPKNKEEWYIENNNVYTNIELSNNKKGKKIKIKNFDGSELLIKIPVTLENEQSLRLKSKGWFINNEKRGDLIITIFFKKEKSAVGETFQKIKSFISKY